MTNDLTRSGSPFDSIRRVDTEGEYWMARDLMPLLGYVEWRKFNDAINRAKLSMAGLGVDTTRVFVAADKNPSELGGRPGMDIRMTRQGAYMVAMNGDPRKAQVGAAQTYFAVKTRQAEVAEQAPALPGTYLDALKALVVSVEEKERAELESAQARAEADMLRPPAEAWEHLADTGQDYDVRMAANILKRDPAIEHMVGPRRLFEWIVANGMAQRRPDGQYVPYASHSDHLRLAPRTRPDRDNPGQLKEANAQLRITAKGLSWIQQRMRDQTRPELVPGPVHPQEDLLSRETGEGQVIDIESVRTSALRR